ncbi:hypothetical protein JOC85_002464 [Bacillus mesophilus]|nr:hypothetical protein [Bacillus mesophilus]
MLSFLFAFIEELFVAIGYGYGLNTKRIDSNIEMLKQEEWFRNIYKNQKYHRLFFANKYVRGYLQSKIRVKRIIHSEVAQRKFVLFLDKQIK